MVLKYQDRRKPKCVIRINTSLSKMTNADVKKWETSWVPCRALKKKNKGNISMGFSHWCSWCLDFESLGVLTGHETSRQIKVVK